MRVEIYDPSEFAKIVFEAGQQAASWLRRAGHLRDAAEVILEHELPAEISYSQAREIAEEEVAAKIRGGDNFATADIKATAPNYPPGQLLYAYAIENVLKGLIVFKRPDLIKEDRLDGELKSHDLNELAKKAKVAVEQEERPVLEALSQLSIWAGRYPVALNPATPACRTPTHGSTMARPIRSCGHSSRASTKNLRARWSQSKSLKE
jgi:hypothetical protein